MVDFWRWMADNGLGNLAEWIGGVGTTLAFLAALIAFLYELQRRHREQPDRIIAWMTFLNSKTIIHVRNTSDRPIMNVYVSNRPRPQPSLLFRLNRRYMKLTKALTERRTVLPELVPVDLEDDMLEVGATVDVQLDLTPEQVAVSRTLVTFTAEGRVWTKELFYIQGPQYRSRRFFGREARYISARSNSWPTVGDSSVTPREPEDKEIPF